MAGFTTYLSNKILDHVFRNTAYTPPAAVYVALYSAAPSDAGGGTELTGGGYARVAATFGSAAAAGAIANTAPVAFAQTSGAWAQATHFGVFDALTTGNLLGWAPLTTPKTVGAGDTASFAIGELDITHD